MWIKRECVHFKLNVCVTTVKLWPKVLQLSLILLILDVSCDDILPLLPFQLLVRFNSNKQHDDDSSFLDDHFPTATSQPRSGTSLVEVCLPSLCDCSSFVFATLMRFLLPMTAASAHGNRANGDGCNATNTEDSHCLLLDCGGRFDVCGFRSYMKQMILTSPYKTETVDFNLDSIVNQVWHTAYTICRTVRS